VRGDFGCKSARALPLLMLRPCQFRKSDPPGLAPLALPLFAAGPPVVFALFGQSFG
jgi:hypothetical protein